MCVRLPGIWDRALGGRSLPKQTACTATNFNLPLLVYSTAVASFPGPRVRFHLATRREPGDEATTAENPLVCLPHSAGLSWESTLTISINNLIICITIVQSHIAKYYEFVAMVSL